MSQLSSYAAYQPLEYERAAAPAMEWVEPLPRSRMQPILLCLPVLFALVGYLGAMMSLVDLAFITLTALCTLFLVQELYNFSRRMGIGGVILYGGVLIWFCYDYLVVWSFTWLGDWHYGFSKDTIARSAFCHMLFILCMSIGLRIRRGAWVYRLAAKLPEPATSEPWLWIVILTQVIGLMPFFVFTAEPFYMAFYHSIIAGRTSLGAVWSVGRTGNANYSWGGYVAQLLQVGTGGAVLAAFYAIFLARAWLAWLLCWLIWAWWLLIGFGGGTRGDVVFLVLPASGFLFIKYHARANELMRRFSLRAYFFVALCMMLMVVLVQTQIRFRGAGFQDVDFSQVDVTNLQGNDMFSEGLAGFAQIPGRHNYFYDNYPGETIVAPIPIYCFFMAIHPIPRVLWTTKVIDPAGPWYNAVAMGLSGEGGGNVEGTTISEGLVGTWYFRYGIAGLIEGGLLYGWLMGLSERILLNCQGKVLPVILSLGVATWLFRSYRDVTFAELYEMLVGLFMMAMLVLMTRPFAGRPAEPAAVGES